MNPLVFEFQARVEGLWKRTHPVHPYLKWLKAFNEGKRVKIILKGFAVEPPGRSLDFIKDIGGPVEMNQMHELILLGSAWKAHINLHDIGFKVRSNEEIDTEVYGRRKWAIPLNLVTEVD